MSAKPNSRDVVPDFWYQIRAETKTDNILDAAYLGRVRKPLRDKLGYEPGEKTMRGLWGRLTSLKVAGLKSYDVAMILAYEYTQHSSLSRAIQNAKARVAELERQLQDARKPVQPQAKKPIVETARVPVAIDEANDPLLGEEQIG